MPHVACRRIAREHEPAARAPLRPAPVLDGTPVGAGAGHMSILAFPTDIVLGAGRRAQGVRSRAASGLLACAVPTASSARAVRCSCAGVDAWVFSCVGRVRASARVMCGAWRWSRTHSMRASQAAYGGMRDAVRSGRVGDRDRSARAGS